MAVRQVSLWKFYHPTNVRPSATESHSVALSSEISEGILKSIIDNLPIKMDSAITVKRVYRPEWEVKYPWLQMDRGRLFCTWCRKWGGISKFATTGGGKYSKTQSQTKQMLFK